MGDTSGGLDGHQPKQAGSNVCQPGSGPDGVRGRRNVLVVGTHGRVSISTVADDTSGLGQAAVSELLADSGPPILAQQSLVSASTPVAGGSFQATPAQRGSSPHAVEPRRSRVSQFPKSASLQTIFEWFVDRGISETVLRRIAEAENAGSSRRVYDSRGERFALWSEQGCRFTRSPVALVASFFEYNHEAPGFLQAG